MLRTRRSLFFFMLLIAIGVSGLVIVGCGSFGRQPLGNVKGVVTVNDCRQADISPTTLTDQHIEKLNRWLEQSKSGWSTFDFNTYAPQLYVHADDFSLNLLPRGFCVINSRQRQYSKQLKPDEHQELRLILQGE